MKQYINRIAVCAIPVLLSAIVVAFALNSYVKGQGGFRLGVDLAGGTVLMYEIDTDKLEESKKADAQYQYSATEMAASLKRRIDPADLYNVTIRPAGQTRVEIILPTGGKYQTEAEEAQWKDLLTEVEKQWKPKTYKVAVDRKTDLVARINEQHPTENIASIEKFIAENYKRPAGADTAKLQAAWDELEKKVQEKWPPQHYTVGRGRLQNLVAQILEQYPDAKPEEVGKFINQNYKLSRERRQFTPEDIQSIKELITQVGSLEFKILANTTDDRDVIEAARRYIESAKTDPTVKQELEGLAVAGKAPPRPLNDDKNPTFETATTIGSYTYSWVEIGKMYRHQLGLNNAAAGTSALWKRAAEAREKGEAMTLNLGANSDSLLYSRKVQNPRLSDREADKQYEYFILTRDTTRGQEVTGKDLIATRPETDQQLQLAVGFTFNSHGGNLFHDLTSKNAPTGGSEFRRHLAIVLDGRIETAPTINAIISTNGIIQGRFTKEEVDKYVRVLKAGQLPASLKPQPASESTMGPTLGEDTIRAGATSVIIAFVAVLLFMSIYYRFAGLVASVALLANLLLTIAFMVLVNATFTLPGLAGLVLTLGMAVDANVLIYERLREERERGASLTLALRNGYDRAFPTIIDTHLSSIFTAIVLYAVGNDQLKGFGISLTAGLVISLFTSLFMTRLMFDVWQYMGWLKKLSMFKLFARPSFRFMAIRNLMFAITVALTVLGAALFIYRLDKGGLNIDFMGGSAYGGQLTKGVDITELRHYVEKSDLPDLSYEMNYSPGFTEGNKSRLFTIRTAEKDPVVVQKKISESLGNLLKRTLMNDPEFDPNNPKEATLTFTDPETGSLGFASRSRVSLLLAEQFKKEGQESLAEQFAVEGLGREQDGHFQWMRVQLTQPIEKPLFTKVLKGVQEEFAARPQPERLDSFDSQFARDTQLRALYAILASWGAILVYLWFRFGNWTFGLAAVLCLIHDLFFTLGAIAFCHYVHEWAPGLASALLIQDFKIDLPAVAALLTLVGYSVNDTIVVFDRIREVRGKNPLLTYQMINDSVNQTLSRTVLASFTTFLVVFVLYLFGGEGVHLFAFVMVVGVVVGTYSSIYIASPLLMVFGEGAPKTELERQHVEAEAIA